MLGDPVIRRVGAFRDDDGVDQRMRARADAAIAHDMDVKIVPPGDLLDFRLHRAGIGIDIDFKHGGRIKQLLPRVC